MDNKALDVLSKYGQIETCKEINGEVVTIVLTEGFSVKAIDTFEFLKTCGELYPDYPDLITCITKNNLAIVILARKRVQNNGD